MTKLGFTRLQANQIQDCLQSAAHGLILVSGPTRSGKSTSYQSITKSVGDQGLYVDFDASGGLRHSLQSIFCRNPGFLCINEIRTKEHVQFACSHAKDRVVISTIHADDSFSAIKRLSDWGVPDIHEPSIPKLIISQRLVRKLCRHCSKPWSTACKDDRANHAVRKFGISKSARVNHLDGCPQCRNGGYFGVSAVAEVLVPDGAYLRLHGEGRRKEAIDHWVEALHGRPIVVQGFRMLAWGDIDVTSFERAMGDLDELDVDQTKRFLSENAD